MSYGEYVKFTYPSQIVVTPYTEEEFAQITTLISRHGDCSMDDTGVHHANNCQCDRDYQEAVDNALSFTGEEA